MNLQTELRINDTKINKFLLKRDTQVKNQFTARQWIPCLTINEGDNIIVNIEDDSGIVSSLELDRASSNGKTIYTARMDTGDKYSWANLVPGYGKTYGLTAAIMFRKRPRPVVDVSDMELSEGAGI
jgi:hypothetical protein